MKTNNIEATGKDIALHVSITFASEEAREQHLNNATHAMVDADVPFCDYDLKEPKLSALVEEVTCIVCLAELLPTTFMYPSAPEELTVEEHIDALRAATDAARAVREEMEAEDDYPSEEELDLLPMPASRYEDIAHTHFNHNNVPFHHVHTPLTPAEVNEDDHRHLLIRPGIWSSGVVVTHYEPLAQECQGLTSLETTGHPRLVTCLNCLAAIRKEHQS